MSVSLAENASEREGSFLGRLAHPHYSLNSWMPEYPRQVEPYSSLNMLTASPSIITATSACWMLRRIVRLFLDVLSAIAHAHANLIVHRDIERASNMLVSNDGQVNYSILASPNCWKAKGNQSAPRC